MRLFRAWSAWGGSVAITIGAGSALLALAAHHPLHPAAALGLSWIWWLACAWQPRWSLWVVPALLPILSLAPWSGWQALDEFDLLLLSTLCAGHGRLVWLGWSAARTGRSAPSVGIGSHSALGAASMASRGFALLLVAALASTMLSIALGVRDAAGDAGAATFWSLPWPWLLHGDYLSPLNPVRVGKSLFLAAAMLPIWRQLVSGGLSVHQATTRIGWGMVAGLGLAAGAVAWERWLFTGLFNFSTPYRATGWFWEMHVGGAAIEAYLALALPFAVWALFAARQRAGRLLAAAILVAGVYATATTFSRSVLFAILLPVSVLLVGLTVHTLRQPAQPSRQTSARPWWPWAFVLVLLAAELAAVIWGGSFMRQRLELTADHFADRTAHWRHGLSLLKSPTDWWFGIGMGRLPQHYAGSAIENRTPDEASKRSQGMPGRLQLRGPGLVAMRGPDTDAHLGGSFALQQVVGTFAPGQYSVTVRLRSAAPARLLIKLCEKHQIYERNCYYAVADLPRPSRADPAESTPPVAPWRQYSVGLAELQHLRPGGQGWMQGAGQWERPAVLSLSIQNTAAEVPWIELAHVGLHDAQGQVLTRNSNFEQGLAHWRQAAGGYYVPWHIDNLLLEWLIERGWFGLLPLAGLSLLAMLKLISRRSDPQSAVEAGPRDFGIALRWTCVTALVSVALIGLVASVMDAPRVAFLMWWLVLGAAAGLWSRAPGRA